MSFDFIARQKWMEMYQKVGRKIATRLDWIPRLGSFHKICLQETLFVWIIWAWIGSWLVAISKGYNGLFLRWSACMLLVGWLPNKRLTASLPILLLDPSCGDMHKHFDVTECWCNFVYITKRYAKLHRQSLDLTPRTAIVFPIVRHVFFVVVCPLRLTYWWITQALFARDCLWEKTPLTLLNIVNARRRGWAPRSNARKVSLRSACSLLSSSMGNSNKRRPRGMMTEP